MEIITENNQRSFVNMVLYSYKKNPGWYPYELSDGEHWTQLNGAIKAWELREDAQEACPPGCKVQKLYLTFEEED